MKRHRILYIIGQLRRGGAERQLLQLAKNMDRARFEPLICCLAVGGELVNEAREAGIPVFILKRHGHFDIRRVLRLSRLMRREQIDIAHSFTYEANMYNILANIFAHDRIIICSERSSGDINEKRTAVIGSFIYRFMDKMIVNSFHGGEFVMQLFKIPEKKMSIVHNGICTHSMRDQISKKSTKDFLRELGIPNSDKQIIGLVGNLWQGPKNHAMFLKAASIVVNSNPHVLFIVIGGGSTQQVMEISRKLGVSDHVIFTGSRSYEETIMIMSQFDIGVLCSTIEGLPNAIMEYMAAGKPVVATDVGGCSELVAEKQTGFLVPQGDEEALAEKLLWLLRHKEQGQRMGQNGAKRIHSKFSIKKMVFETTKIYDRLARKSTLSPKLDFQEILMPTQASQDVPTY